MQYWKKIKRKAVGLNEIPSEVLKTILQLYNAVYEQNFKEMDKRLHLPFP